MAKQTMRKGAGPVSARIPPGQTSGSEAILRAAKDLFIKNGFDGVTVARIAAKAGVSKGLVHHHFGSKEELYFAFLDRYFGIFAGKLRKYVEPLLGRDDLVEAAFLAYFRFLGDNPEFVRMQLWANLFFQQTLEAYKAMDSRAGVNGDDDDALFLRRFGAQMIHYIKEQQELGKFRRDVMPDIMFASAMCLAEHWHETKRRKIGRWFALDASSEAIENLYMEQALKVFLDGVRA